jgi:uncharacterized membrane protein
MPSDSLPHPSSSGPERPRYPHHARHLPIDPAESSAERDSAPAVAVPPEQGASNEARGRYNPRIIAALCYAIPYVVSVGALLRERRNRFVRFHAAQSIIFFVTIPAIQLILFVVLIVVGNTVDTGPWSVVLGVLFIGGFLALGVGAFLFWLRLLADCWAGRATAFPVIGALAHRMERLLTRVQREIATSRPLRQNGNAS